MSFVTNKSLKVALEIVKSELDNSLPTKVSLLENDSQYITSIDTYSRELIDWLLSSIDTSELASKEELNGKVDKVEGKQLSTEDFTTELKLKLDNLESAEANQLISKLLTNEDLNTIRDVNFSSYYAHYDNTCTNKPSGVYDFSLTCQICGNDRFVQKLYDRSGDYYYIRDSNGTSWYSWKRLLTTSDLTSLTNTITSLTDRITALEARPTITSVTSLPLNPNNNTLYCIPE